MDDDFNFMYESFGVSGPRIVLVMLLKETGNLYCKTVDGAVDQIICLQPFLTVFGCITNDEVFSSGLPPLVVMKQRWFLTCRLFPVARSALWIIACEVSNLTYL